MNWEYIVLQCWGMECVVNFYGTERYSWFPDPPTPDNPPPTSDQFEGNVFYYMKKLGEDGWELVGAESKKFLLLIFKRPLQKQNNNNAVALCSVKHQRFRCLCE